MKNRRFLAFTVLSLVATIATGTPASPSTLDAIQSFGVRLKIAADHARGGKQPESKTLVDFEQTLIQLRSAAAGDPQLQRKYQAIMQLFDNLRRQTAHPSPAPGKPYKAMRAQVDLEVVTDHHGGSCANALGISENLPIQLTLGHTGSIRSDVWFRFTPRADARVQFTTDSTGPDPALEVFSGCEASAAKLAGNDDAIGLDAAVSVSSANHQPLFVHLGNSGLSGRVVIGVNSMTATVNGSVRDAKTGYTIESASVQLLDSNGYYTGYTASTDAGGNYSIDVAYAGDYYVRTDASYLGGNYLSQLYPAGACWPSSWGITGCDLANTQTVSIADGASVTGINFALSKGQKVAGQVRDDMNQPIAYADLQLFDDTDMQRGYVNTDEFGRYAFNPVPSGNYKVTAQANGYGSQMFDHIACGGPLQTQCDLSQAANVSISNQDFTKADFSLAQLATIQGTIFNVISTSPPTYFPQVEVLDTNGNSVAPGFVDPVSGHYLAGPLAPGSYYVVASSNGYFSQIFDGIDCTSDCTQERPGATQVTIATAGQQVQADFHLTQLPIVHGHVQDATTGLPLANVSIQASLTAPGDGSLWWPANTTTTDVDGDYILSGTVSGQYYLWAQSDDHIDELYPNVPCEAFINQYNQILVRDCNSANATQLTIALGQIPAAFDFTLDPASSISGHAATRAGAGSNLAASVGVSAYADDGTPLAQAQTDALGNYVMPDLPPATYFADAQSQWGWTPQYIGQVWQQQDCVGMCDPTTGTPIPLTAATAANGVDFDLTELDAVVGRVTNVHGDPIGGTVIDLFVSSTGAYAASALTNAQGYYAVYGNLDTGYFVATEAAEGYIDQIYADIPCLQGSAYFGACPFTNATAVTLGSNAIQPHIINFVLQASDPIFANGFE